MATITIDDQRAKRDVTFGDIELGKGFARLNGPRAGEPCIKTGRGDDARNLFNLVQYQPGHTAGSALVRRVPVEIVVGEAEGQAEDELTFGQLSEALAEVTLFSFVGESPPRVLRHIKGHEYEDIATGKTYIAAVEARVRRVRALTMTINDD